MKRIVLVLSLTLFSVFAYSSPELLKFDDPIKEQRYRLLISELRCLVCQNQNLADSNAELAQDMRRKTYELVQSGATHDEVVDFMVKRYGDFVLFRPPFKLSTLLLWIGPFLLFLGGIVIILLLIKKSSLNRSTKPDERELNRIRGLLDDLETKS